MKLKTRPQSHGRIIIELDDLPVFAESLVFLPSPFETGGELQAKAQQDGVGGDRQFTAIDVLLRQEETKLIDGLPEAARLCLSEGRMNQPALGMDSQFVAMIALDRLPVPDLQGLVKLDHGIRRAAPSFLYQGVGVFKPRPGALRLRLDRRGPE